MRVESVGCGTRSVRRNFALGPGAVWWLEEEEAEDSWESDRDLFMADPHDIAVLRDR